MKKIILLANLLLSLSAFAQLPTYVSPNGLVAFWPFNGNANDASGNGNNGTVNGAILTNRYGVGAYYFDNTAASNSYIQTTINTSAITTNGAMTLSFWINRVGNGYLGSRVMEFGSCPNCAGQILVTWANLNQLIVRHYLTNSAFVADTITTATNGVWYNVVYTNDGTTAKFYLNGSLINTTPSPASDPVQLLGNTAFGRMNHPSYDAFNGDLDDIGLWSRALTYCEVQQLFTGSSTSGFIINNLSDTTFICDSTILDAGADPDPDDGAGAYTYKWSTNQTTELITVKNGGWYKVAVTNSLGCVAYDSTYVISIKPTISQNDTTVCSGSSIVLTANGIASSQTPSINFHITDSFYNTYPLTTVIGQTYSLVVSGETSVHGSPSTDGNNPADAAFYLHSPFPAIPTSTNPTMNLDWVIWNGVPVRPDVDVYNPVTHIYTYTLPASTQIIQTFSSIDLSDIAPYTNPSAYNDNWGGLTFSISQINKSTATYTWSAKPTATAGLSASDINKQSLTVKPTATTTYYVIVNDGATSCEDSVTLTVPTIDTSVTVSGVQTICAGIGSVGLHAATGLSSYKWLSSGTAIAGATSKDYTATQTGTYSVVVTNSIGCSDTSRSIVIAANPKPVAAFTINTAMQCLNGNSFTFTNTSTISSGTISYKWNLGDDSTGITKNITHTYLIANPSYAVQLIDSSNNGCMDTVSQNVVVKSSPAGPTITTGGATTICQGGTVTLTSNATSSNQWYNNGTSINGATSQTYTANATGVYTVISTINNCASDSGKDVTVTINSTPSTPTITFSGSDSICQNKTLALMSSAATGNQWYNNGTAIIGATGNTYTASSAATYTVVDSVNNCPSNASTGTVVTIVSSPAKPAITAGGSVTICQGGSVVLTSSSSTGNQWYNNAILISGATDNSYTASTTGAYTVSVSNNCGSSLSDDTTVNIIPSPSGIRYPSVNVEIGSAYTLQARNFGNNDYLWTPSVQLDSYTTATPTTDNFTHSQDYIIQITTGVNCITNDSLLVTAYPAKGILMPNAFSPNNDGLNDKVTPTLVNVKELVYFRIFNEWGQLIFQTSNANNGWDGTYQGIAQPVGNYVWIAQGIDESGNVINEHGQILIVR